LQPSSSSASFALQRVEQAAKAVGGGGLAHAAVLVASAARPQTAGASAAANPGQGHRAQQESAFANWNAFWE
jgi:hypothetical protein